MTSKPTSPAVLILLGSASDLPSLEKTKTALKALGIRYSLRITSAHRSPEATKALVVSAEEKGFEVILAAAGLAAHLPGVCAAYTTLPVIGIPIENGPLSGMDALYSIVMMPPGVPVAAVAIGKTGAHNAALYAAQILALKYPPVKEALNAFRAKQRSKVEQDNLKFQEQG